MAHAYEAGPRKPVHEGEKVGLGHLGYESGSWVLMGGLEGEWALALSGYSPVTPQTPSLIDRGLASWGLGQ